METQSGFLMSVPQLFQHTFSYFPDFYRTVAKTIKNHVDYPYFLKVKYANETALPLKYKQVQSSQFDFLHCRWHTTSSHTWYQQRSHLTNVGDLNRMSLKIMISTVQCLSLERISSPLLGKNV